MKKHVVLLLIGLFLALHPTFAQQKETPYVILISFDGFRYDYVKQFNPPNLQAFIRQGSQAERLIPSFPSKTFPNHYTIVTGLVPGHHGLVDNSFYDPSRRTSYGMRDQTKVVDSYYYGGTSLWQLAKQNGMISASYFWVGSEQKDEARRPDYFYPFDDRMDPNKRIEQTLNWLKLPGKNRPHLITLYFSSPDHESHTYGPNSLQVKNAVLRADSLLGNLMIGLKSLRVPVNVIIVSDHGMRELIKKPETYIFIDELLNRKDTTVTVIDGGTHTHLYFRSMKKRDSVYSFLKSKEQYFKVYRKEEYPERWHYRVDRAGDLLIEADSNHYIYSGSRERFQKTGEPIGVHGYDPEQVMAVSGIFYASGPNIKKGVTIPAFQNIHIYPFIAKILGLPLPPIDGREEVLLGIYKEK